MSCPCDETTWPPPLDIPAGLSDLPRQQFVFAELRRAMLDKAKNQAGLSEWRARAADDFGVMWLELWAYVGELLSLYDKAIADESYVRTAKLRPSLRRLLESLGYVPTPAVAASVELALFADGVRPVELPTGTGFRSGAFDDEPPQVFELVAPATIHPFLNRFEVITPTTTTLSGTVEWFYLDPATAQLAIDDWFLIELGTSAANCHTRKAANVERIVDDAKRRLVKVTMDRAIVLASPVALTAISIRKPTQWAALKKPFGTEKSYTFSSGGSTGYDFEWTLDRLYPEPREGTRALIKCFDEVRWVNVYRHDALQATVVTDVTDLFSLIYVIENVDDPSRMEATDSQEWLDLVGHDAAHTMFTVCTAMIRAGKVVGEALPAILPTDPLKLKRTRVPVNSTAATARLIVRDGEERAVGVDGTVDLAKAELDVASDAWTPALAAPLEAFGNIVTAVRGQSVPGEILGSGDATVESQSFKLAKKPLTYVAAAGADNAAGVASTLTVWVDGLQWTEVASFFGQAADAQVYIVRQNDDSESFVTFGDGIRGARLTTGVDNVVASYRFGAGAASPPAGSIAQLAKPVPGLQKVIGPLEAGGGEDAEDAESIRELAPRSALLLGRAISIEDFEVAAQATPGVTTAKADWTWDGTCQRPVVKVWIVAGPGVDETVAARLAEISDPNTPIFVDFATAVTASLTIDLELDPKRVASDVLASVEDALLGDDGWLLPENLGIAEPLLRSPLLARLLSITGVTGVKGLTWNGSPFTGFGVDPGTGSYFELTNDTAVTGS